MNVAAYVEALQQDLANVAGIGDEAVAEAARRISAALESSLRLRLMDALGEAAAELTNQLPDGHVEVRVTGGEPELVYVPEPGAPPPSGLDDLSARITLQDRKSTRLNSSHLGISYAVFCLKKKKK